MADRRKLTTFFNRFLREETAQGYIRSAGTYSTVMSLNGVPVLLLEATRLASRWAQLDVPYESVTIWPVFIETDSYFVTFRNPSTGLVDNLPVPFRLPGRFHFESYQRWLEDAQAAQMQSVEKQFNKMNRSWWS